MIDKYINDRDEVAVIYHNAYGNGWNDFRERGAVKHLFDPIIVQWILSDEEYKKQHLNSIMMYVSNTYEDDASTSWNSNDMFNLRVRWVPDGSRFRISSYDGQEWVVLESEEEWIEA